MYFWNLLNEEFRDGFLIYNDIFVVCTTRKWKQYIGNAAEMARFKKILRVHSLETEDNYVIRRNETKGS